jgi:hypothetical protein
LRWLRNTHGSCVFDFINPISPFSATRRQGLGLIRALPGICIKREQRTLRLDRHVSLLTIGDDMFLIQIGTRYFSARGGHLGGLVSMADATRFSLEDAIGRASRTAGAVVRPCPEYAAQRLEARQANRFE